MLNVFVLFLFSKICKLNKEREKKTRWHFLTFHPWHGSKKKKKSPTWHAFFDHAKNFVNTT